MIKAFDDLDRAGKISRLKMLIKREEGGRLSRPIRHPLSMEDALPFESRRTMVYVGSPGRQAAIPAVEADRRTAVEAMDKLLAELEGDEDAAA